METRAAAKRRATAPTQLEIQHLKKQRVVLAELPNIPNFIQSPTTNEKKPHSTVEAKSLKFQDPNLVDEPYVSDIHSYLRSMEMEKKRRPMVDYIQKVQKDVTANMRGVLVDWLVEVADEYKLLPETLFLSVSYIDRFLSVNPVVRSKFQLLGVSSMLVASKYEEINPPNVKEFCYITEDTYTKSQVVQMEADILKSLKFEMGNPTVKTFLSMYSGIASQDKKIKNSQIEFLSCYLAELSLLDYSCVKFLPSMIAASVIFLARFIIWPVVHPWTSSLHECSGYTSLELKECVLILHDLYMSRRAASLSAVREKYKQHKFKCVANLSSSPSIPSSYFK
ncbi:cyclin [Stylosanthes scabra]|uniref:B-like cyclin n=1 Tax=Stylosanthes scabra TaxID=79078 RepID=A0ABU6UL66_9FABA|nr:cyclin [Stylosanthes scabra]